MGRNVKFHVKGVTRTNHSSCQKNDLSYSIKIWTHFSFVLSQSTRLTDGQTDGQTEFSSLDRVCIPCSAVKTSRVTVTSLHVRRRVGDREQKPLIGS